MENRISYISNLIKWAYALFWIAPFAIVLIGETFDGWTGFLTGDTVLSYYLETLEILFTVVCVPFSLKLFSWALRKKIDQVTFPVALSYYLRYSLLRIFLLGVPVVLGCLLYYQTFSNTGLLCALIALTASLFCFPSEKRLRIDLQIDKEEEK